jgi:hypothetical protein
MCCSQRVICGPQNASREKLLPGLSTARYAVPGVHLGSCPLGDIFRIGIPLCGICGVVYGTLVHCAVRIEERAVSLRSRHCSQERATLHPDVGHPLTLLPGRHHHYPTRAQSPLEDTVSGMVNLCGECTASLTSWWRLQPNLIAREPGARIPTLRLAKLCPSPSPYTRASGPSASAALR